MQRPGVRSERYAYTPPVYADGTPYPNASFTNDEGYAYQGTGTLRSSSTSHAVATGTGVTFTLERHVDDVQRRRRRRAGVPAVGRVCSRRPLEQQCPGGTGTKVIDITSIQGSGTYNSWYVSQMGALNNSTYYTYTGTQPLMGWTYNASSVITSTTFYQECMSNIGNSPGSSKFTLQTVTTASSAAMQQNYANWSAYYQTRRLLMRTAAGKAFQTLDNSFRVGFTTISDTGVTQGTNKFLDIGDFDTAKKAAFYNSLYTATGNSYTPLRGALSKVGRYFANKAPGQASDPMQYSCQRNFTILSTDGYWNNNTETSSYGPLEADHQHRCRPAGRKRRQADVGRRQLGRDDDDADHHDHAQGDDQHAQRHGEFSALCLYRCRRAGAAGAPTRSTASGFSNRTRPSHPRPPWCDRDDDQRRDNTVVTTNGVVTSNTNSAPANSTANVSSTTTTGTPAFGAWGNSGGTTDYCLTTSQLARRCSGRVAPTPRTTRAPVAAAAAPTPRPARAARRRAAAQVRHAW